MTTKQVLDRLYDKIAQTSSATRYFPNAYRYKEWVLLEIDKLRKDKK